MPCHSSVVRQRARTCVCRIEMPSEHSLLHLGLALSPPSLLLQKELASSHAPPLVAQSGLHTRTKSTKHACTQTQHTRLSPSRVAIDVCTCCTHPSIHAHVAIYTCITARTLERTNHARAPCARTHACTHARKHKHTHLPRNLCVCVMMMMIMLMTYACV